MIGPNGAGKTTLFRMLTGNEAPDSGSLTVGDTVKLGYVDQSRDALDDDKTVWEVISDGLDELELGKRTVPSRAYVSNFNFKGADQQKKVGQLSGGERNRVHLARMLKVARISCYSMSQTMIWMWLHYALLKKPCLNLQDVRW